MRMRILGLNAFLVLTLGFILYPEFFVLSIYDFHNKKRGENVHIL